MPDSRIELAYEATLANLKWQDTGLANLRNRATGLFSAAAVVTTFSTAVGLIATDPTKGKVLPAWAAISSLALVVLIGAAVMYVQWPVREWAYGPSGEAMLSRIDNEKEVDEDDIRRKVVERSAPYIVANDKHVKRRSRAYRTAIVLLGVEVIVLVLPIVIH